MDGPRPASPGVNLGTHAPRLGGRWGPLSAGIACVFFSAAGCASTRLTDVGRPGYTRTADEERLARRAEEFCALLDTGGRIYEDPGLDGYLDELAARLLPPEARAQGLAVTVKVLRDPTLNAFTLPNGRIYVNVGILAAARNEAQFASILGHEIGHLVHRHQLKRMRSLTNKTAFYSAVYTPVVAAGGVLAGLGLQAGTISSIYGYSRRQESEADAFTFETISRCGYDPREAVKLFERMDTLLEAENVRSPVFFSTHPAIAARIENFQQLLHDHPLRIEENPVRDTPVYRRRRLILLKTAVRLCLERGAFASAEIFGRELLDARPKDAEVFYLMGELYRRRQDPPEGKTRRDKTEDWTQALTYYDEALSRDGRHVESMKGKGLVLRRLGKKEEAARWLGVYLAAAPQASDRELVEALIEGLRPGSAQEGEGADGS